jgi:peptide/nickel transport system substrate-binding protein
VFNRQIAALSVALALVLAACTPAPKGNAPTQSGTAAEQPQPGGTLTFIVNAEPPSFDGHRETTFALLHPIAPHYSTIYKFDPADLTKVVPDVAAAMPEISADKLTYTIKLRTDVKFHDGTKMTSDDVVATYQKIIFPPTGVLSPRAGAYAAVDTISNPAPDSVVFKLKYPSASFATNLHLRLEHEGTRLGRQEVPRLLREG